VNIKYFNSKISISLIIISIIIFIYILYRNLIYYTESSLQHYYEYYFFSLFFFIFSILILFIKENIKINILLISLSIIFTFYFIELFLNIFDHTWKRNFSSKSETKYQLIKKERIKNSKVFSPLSPMIIKVNNDKVFTMSGISNVQNIHCNEMGYFSKYKSDKYGFNNPNNNVWAKDTNLEYIIVGDSFAHGNCVNEKDTIAGNLRKISKENLINIGYGGSGPLLEYARLLEYFPKEKGVKKILWLFCGENDLMDLKIEVKQKILQNYLNEENFSQDLKSKTKKIDSQLKIFHEEIIQRWKEESQFNNFLKLQKLRWYILYYMPKNYDYETFKKIMKNVNNFANENNSKLYFVYIPSDSFVNTKQMFRTEHDEVTKIIKELNIPIIDIYDELFKNEKNTKKYFPPNGKGHYNPLGNQEVAKIIYTKTN